MIRRDMSQSEYRAAPGYSSTQLKRTIDKNVGWSAAPFERTEPMIVGDALHACLLEPDRWSDEFVLEPEGLITTIPDAKAALGKIKGSSAWKADEWMDAAEQAGLPTRRVWERGLNGRASIGVAMRDEVVRMAAAVREHPSAGPLLSSGRSEVSFLVDELPHDGAEGRVTVPAKCRADFLCDVGSGCIIDAKKTLDASPAGFARQAASLHYHLQAAWYVDVVREETGVELPFVFVCVEVDDKGKTAAVHPNDRIAVYWCPEEAINAGRGAYRRALDMHIRASRDRWTGYDREPQILQLPVWALRGNP